MPFCVKPKIAQFSMCKREAGQELDAVEATGRQVPLCR